LAPTPFSVICFRALPPDTGDSVAVDQLNMELMERVNASGEIYLSHTRLDTGIALRVAIGNLGTTEDDVERCRELLEKELECLCRR
jgi:aromatic-L-amino-acid decarboxylase